MNDQERQKRRHKRLQKQKQRRDDKSRPGRGPSDAARDPLAARTWPLGDCWISQTWDEPGAKLAAIVSRVHESGDCAVAAFTIDRSGPGLLTAELRGGLRPEHVTARAGALGEESGVAMIETTGALIAALVRDAVSRGANGVPKGGLPAVDWLAGVESASLPTEFGPEAVKKAPERGGLLGAISRWFGG